MVGPVASWCKNEENPRYKRNNLSNQDIVYIFQVLFIHCFMLKLLGIFGTLWQMMVSCARPQHFICLINRWRKVPCMSNCINIILILDPAEKMPGRHGLCIDLRDHFTIILLPDFHSESLSRFILGCHLIFVCSWKQQFVSCDILPWFCFGFKQDMGLVPRLSCFSQQDKTKNLENLKL